MDLNQDIPIAQTISLIDSYDFDLGGHSKEKLIEDWSNIYPASWIRLATIEALYQGRYKLVSIEQILNVWLRIGNPNTHFSYEFERLICRKLPKHLIKSNTSESIDDALSEKNSNFEIPGKVVSDSQDKSAIAAVNNTQYDQQLEESKASAIKVVKHKNYQSSNMFSLSSIGGMPYHPNWSDFSVENPPIHQFIPLPDVSSFFNKLKAFAGEKLTEEKVESPS